MVLRLGKQGQHNRVSTRGGDGGRQGDAGVAAPCMGQAGAVQYEVGYSCTLDELISEVVEWRGWASARH